MHAFPIKFRSLLLLAGVTLPSVFLTGCGSGSSSNAGSATTVAAVVLQGKIRNGQQPVAGASIQLWTVGTSGYASQATPLLTSTVVSDINGNFKLNGLFSCTSATEVYVTAVGGDPGIGQKNPNLAMMTALGACTAAQQMSSLSINELTTVAAVSRLAPFMDGYSQIGVSSSDQPLLQAAFSDAAILVDPASGISLASSLPAGATVNTTLINTLGNILAACINTVGGFVGDGSACGTLFANSFMGTDANADTVTAMLHIAREPVKNLVNLIASQAKAPPFQPAYSTPPSSVSLQVMRAGLVALPDYNFFGYSLTEGYAYTPTITILNNSSAPIAITGHDVSTSTPGDFNEYSWNCPAQLAAGATCTWVLRLFPSTTAGENGVYQIENSSSVPVLSILGNSLGQNDSLSAGSQISLAPSTVTVSLHEYGRGTNTAYWGGSSTITLTNQTTRTIVYSNPMLAYTGTGPSVAAGTCSLQGGTLAPGASCTYSLDITYPEEKAVYGTVFVNDLTDASSASVSFSAVYN